MSGWPDDNGGPLPVPGSPEDDAALLAGGHTGSWLDAQNFDPLRWGVPGLIPEGFTLVVGPPKAGKSALILNMQLAVASGGTALSAIDCGPARPVLYLSLEDGDRRMQDRCRVMLGEAPIPAGFTYYTDLADPGRVGHFLRAWMRAHPDTGMIVIDTLTKMLAMSKRTEDRTTSATVREYRNIDWLKGLAKAYPGLCMVVVHHARKRTGEDGGDFIERVSGTTGLTAAANTILVVDRDRGAEAGLIQVTGHDLREADYAATFTGLRNWRLDGGDLGGSRRLAALRVEAAGLSEDMRRVLMEVNKSAGGIHVRQLGELFPGWSAGKVNTYAARLAERGLTVRAGRGLYFPIGATIPGTDNTNNGEGVDAH